MFTAKVFLGLLLCKDSAFFFSMIDVLFLRLLLLLFVQGDEQVVE